MKCEHNLIDIQSFTYGPGTYRTVRWCTKCGGVVIDMDVDGRIWPGHIMSMRFPEIVKSVQIIENDKSMLYDFIKNNVPKSTLDVKGIILEENLGKTSPD